MCCRIAIVLGLIFSASTAWAQFPTPTEEHAILKKDVGTWNATLKMYFGEDGKVNPDAEPTVSEGKEVCKMLGEFWVLCDYSGSFAGTPFQGHAVSGYNPQMKKFVSSWVDSVAPYAMHMTGTYDPKTKTLTSFSTGTNLEGKEVKGKSVLVYKDDDHRELTMYELKEGSQDEYVRSMEVIYTRQSK